jgi:hypothetical protein
LEHGGAAPAIIDRSADLDRLIEPLTKGGYYHAGQVCVSVQRIYVHADLESAFLDRFAARVAALKVGDPILLETEAGPLIHPARPIGSWPGRTRLFRPKPGSSAADASAAQRWSRQSSSTRRRTRKFQRSKCSVR